MDNDDYMKSIEYVRKYVRSGNLVLTFVSSKSNWIGTPRDIALAFLAANTVPAIPNKVLKLSNDVKMGKQVRSKAISEYLESVWSNLKLKFDDVKSKSKSKRSAKATVTSLVIDKKLNNRKKISDSTKYTKALLKEMVIPILDSLTADDYIIKLLRNLDSDNLITLKDVGILTSQIIIYNRLDETTAVTLKLFLKKPYKFNIRILGKKLKKPKYATTALDIDFLSWEFELMVFLFMPHARRLIRLGMLDMLDGLGVLDKSAVSKIVEYQSDLSDNSDSSEDLSSVYSLSLSEDDLDMHREVVKNKTDIDTAMILLKRNWLGDVRIYISPDTPPSIYVPVTNKYWTITDCTTDYHTSSRDLNPINMISKITQEINHAYKTNKSKAIILLTDISGILPLISTLEVSAIDKCVIATVWRWASNYIRNPNKLIVYTNTLFIPPVLLMGKSGVKTPKNILTLLKKN